ncbi:hypothetical protein GQ42DRAFT_153364 [Ramicandelaber brevisporus]|nr:hypothetical protein GQ42DRAFT_153364 [Ramicandelaber brevisporus]
MSTVRGGALAIQLHREYRTDGTAVQIQSARLEDNNNAIRVDAEHRKTLVSVVQSLGVAAVLAAAAAVVSATDVYYGSSGIKPVNYGKCTHASATEATIIDAEKKAEFKCWKGGVADIDCYGTGSPETACPKIAARCSSYKGKWEPKECPPVKY